MEKKLEKKIIIKVSEVSKSFNNNVVLKDINFQLLEGESLAIIGASGSGKSVLLKNIIGLLLPDKGSIQINDTEMVHLNKTITNRISQVVHPSISIGIFTIYHGIMLTICNLYIPFHNNSFIGTGI